MNTLVADTFVPFRASLARTLTAVASAAALLAIAALAATPSTATAADPAAELSGFSSFRDFKLDSVAGGTVLTRPSPLMAFTRGISVQSAFVIQAPVKDVARGLTTWSGVRHGDLKVFVHENVTKAGGFNKLSTVNNGSYRNFLKATGQGIDGVHVSKAEAEELKKDPAGAWPKVLSERASSFGSATYDTPNGPVTARGDARSIIGANAFLAKQFPSLVSLVSGGKASPSYWEFFDVQGTGAVNIGTTKTATGADGTMQVLDWQYYASGGFYTNLVFYQLWPVQIGGKEATLVWRGDFLSVPESPESKGMGRLGATAIMQQEVKKVAGYLQQDLKK
ncbi:hypothetical protein DB346_05755 [Verrucomicrobia bacterium LW23]|nr:hypothetical protein DB346_05755 [Verrucomicrobia bacterium LW23]